MTFSIPYKADQAILAVLTDEPQTFREISDKLREKVWREREDKLGRPLDIAEKLRATHEARKQGLQVHPFEVRRRLLSMEKRRIVARVPSSNGDNRVRFRKT